MCKIKRDSFSYRNCESVRWGICVVGWSHILADYFLGVPSNGSHVCRARYVNYVIGSHSYFPTFDENDLEHEIRINI